MVLNESTQGRGSRSLARLLHRRLMSVAWPASRFIRRGIGLSGCTQGTQAVRMRKGVDVACRHLICGLRAVPRSDHCPVVLAAVASLVDLGLSAPPLSCRRLRVHRPFPPVTPPTNVDNFCFAGTACKRSRDHRWGSLSIEQAQRRSCRMNITRCLPRSRPY